MRMRPNRYSGPTPEADRSADDFAHDGVLELAVDAASTGAAATLVERQHWCGRRTRQLLELRRCTVEAIKQRVRQRNRPASRDAAASTPSVAFELTAATASGCAGRPRAAGRLAALSHSTPTAAVAASASRLIEVSMPRPSRRRRPGSRSHRRPTADRRTRSPPRLGSRSPPSLHDRRPGRSAARAEVSSAPINHADALDRDPRRPICARRSTTWRRVAGSRVVETLSTAAPSGSRARISRRSSSARRTCRSGIPLHRGVGQRVRGGLLLPDLGLVVETDGGRFHRTPSQQTRDRRRDQTHTRAGLDPASLHPRAGRPSTQRRRGHPRNRAPGGSAAPSAPAAARRASPRSRPARPPGRSPPPPRRPRSSGRCGPRAGRSAARRRTRRPRSRPSIPPGRRTSRGRAAPARAITSRARAHGSPPTADVGCSAPASSIALRGSASCARTGVAEVLDVGDLDERRLLGGRHPDRERLERALDRAHDDRGARSGPSRCAAAARRDGRRPPGRRCAGSSRRARPC